VSAGPGVSAASITPVVVRLKLSLLRNGLRQSAGRRAAFIASTVLVLLFAVLQLLGLIALRGNEHATAVGVLLVAVLALGWTMGLTVAAEGVETAEQCTFLEAAGCKEMQGHYFSPAVPENEIAALLADERFSSAA